MGATGNSGHTENSSAHLSQQLRTGQIAFKNTFGYSESAVIRSPGRAEIIGNHTDYNCGYALAAAISSCICAFVGPRSDQVIRVATNQFPESEAVSFSLSERIEASTTHTWTNYIRGVAERLYREGIHFSGADIYIQSSLPISGGLSSSAALELGIAHCILNLSAVEKDPLWIARMCQDVENSYVGSPCGLLDQAAVAFGRQDNFVFLDFLPTESSPLSELKLIPSNLSSSGLSFVVIVDKAVKRELGLSGYPARRRMCEESLPFWSEALQREISTLREVSSAEFECHAAELMQRDDVMHKRVKHVVYENERVLKAVRSLEQGNFAEFGELLTASGESALTLYDLDEDTPELTALFNTARSLNGVSGVRNMGGGFSAVVLALVEDVSAPAFQEELSRIYESQFSSTLEFIYFTPADGVGPVSLPTK